MMPIIEPATNKTGAEPSGGLCTNCDYKINKDHQTPSLTFSLCSRNNESCYDRNDKGGFNIRVTKVANLKRAYI